MKKKYRLKKVKKNKKKSLESCPQKTASCFKLVIVKPKKPNSASRKVVKALFNKNKKMIYAHIPGEGHNLHKHSTVLVRGAYLRDLPGVKYRIIRGAKGYECGPILNRKVSRSKYGTKKN
jgi:small subunit ribosomal protein S12